ncbi:MAG: glucose/arabinose dehydrogenase [Phycisphaerales bacterium]|jgi:glucose/arabinose dehydrogenase
MRIYTISAAACLGLTLTHAHAQTLSTELVASGLVRPVFVTHAPGDDSRLFVIEKQGRVRIIDLATGTLITTSFLNIDPLVGGGTSNNDERGLLGLAFHPGFQTNGRFFVNYTNNGSDTVVAEYTTLGDPATSNIADPTSARQILSFSQPQTNHNGGWLGFGPNDGYLYIASGDGGGGGDDDAGHNSEIGNGQSLFTLLGKMLRIDIDTDGFPADTARNYGIPPSNPFTAPLAALDEIWAYGLRNPWRPSFDRDTGDLYIADVGQSTREEVNVQLAASPGGENYGWRCKEGELDFNTTNCFGTFTDPIHNYTHNAGCSITGGYVYRGCAIPELNGWYLFGDYCNGTVWALTTDGVSRTGFQILSDQDRFSTFSSLASFGEDANGELYIVQQGSGQVHRAVPEAPIDTNDNGVPDSCEQPPCPADLNGDGILDNGDIGEFINLFLAGDLAADMNGDGILDNGDIGAFVNLFLAGC